MDSTPRSGRPAPGRPPVMARAAAMASQSRDLSAAREGAGTATSSAGVGTVAIVRYTAAVHRAELADAASSRCRCGTVGQPVAAGPPASLRLRLRSAGTRRRAARSVPSVTTGVC